MGLNAYIHGRHVWSGDTYYCSIRDRTSKVGVELPFRRDTGTRRVIDKRSICGRGYHRKLAMGILTLEIYSKPLMGIRPWHYLYTAVVRIKAGGGGRKFLKNVEVNFVKSS